MRKGGIHLGDVGTVVRCVLLKPDDTPLDLAAASEVVINFQRPDGTGFERTAELDDDVEENNQVVYTLATGDIDVIGYWFVQARITWGGGAELHSDRVRFRVWSNNAAPS